MLYIWAGYQYYNSSYAKYVPIHCPNRIPIHYTNILPMHDNNILPMYDNDILPMRFTNIFCLYYIYQQRSLSTVYPYITTICNQRITSMYCHILHSYTVYVLRLNVHYTSILPQFSRSLCHWTWKGRVYGHCASFLHHPCGHQRPRMQLAGPIACDSVLVEPAESFDYLPTFSQFSQTDLLYYDSVLVEPAQSLD